MVRDPWNPSVEDVLEWAYDPSSEDPCQDWDLALTWVGHQAEYIRLACDKNCPKREFFLHMLYLMVGDPVRSNYRSVSKEAVLAFIQQGRYTSDQDVQLWRERSLELLKKPDTFNYHDWCGGGLARS